MGGDLLPCPSLSRGGWFLVAELPTGETVESPSFACPISATAAYQMGSEYVSVSTWAAGCICPCCCPCPQAVSSIQEASHSLVEPLCIGSQSTPGQCSRNKMPQPEVDMQSLWWTQSPYLIFQSSPRSQGSTQALCELPAFLPGIGSHGRWCSLGHMLDGEVAQVNINLAEVPTEEWQVRRGVMEQARS